MSISNYLINFNKSMRDVILKMNANKKQFLIVIDNKKKVVASITDGDIRRSLIKNDNIDISIKNFANFKPTITYNDNKRDVLSIMDKYKINQLPLLSEKGSLKKIFFRDELGIIPNDIINTPVIIMAGGKGERLRPLTLNTPKPMLKINGKPMLQLVIDNLKLYGFHKFIISVNYKANLIKKYFQKNVDQEVSVSFIHEKKRLGTIGALTLLKESKFKNILVINADVMTGINYNSMLSFHFKNKADMTIGVKKISKKIDYGVVINKNNRVSNFQEKPEISFDVCAGVYVIKEDLIKLIPRDTYYDINQLILKSLNNKKILKSFQIFENWSDIGNMKDYNSYLNVFKK